MKGRFALMVLWAIASMLVLAQCSGPQPKVEPTPSPEPQALAAPAGEEMPVQAQAAPLVDEMGAGKSNGKALLEERCVACHDLARTTSKKKTAEGWKATVERMVGKGAVLNAEEQQVLIDYLAKTYSQ